MIAVEPGLLAGGRSGDTVLLRVRSAAGLSRLGPALRAAAADIAALDGGWQSAFGLAPEDRNGPKYVSDPVALPDGYLLMVDFGSTPTELVRTVPELLVRRLAEAGVPEAAIGTAERFGDQYGRVEEFGPAARAWLRGPPGRPLGDALRQPPTWLLDAAASWLHREAPPGTQPVGLVISVDVALSWPTLVPDLAPTLGSQTPVAVVATDFVTTAGAVAVGDGYRDTLPQASLTAAGQGWGAAELSARLTVQRDLVREHASVLAWAGVSGEAAARGLRSAGWSDPAPGAARPDPAYLPDLLVPDGMWYQLLSEGHLERLGGPPAGARRLGAGWVELTVGEPEQWLPGHPDRPALQARARELLRGCLASGTEVAALTRDRMRAARARDTEGFFPGRRR